LNYCDDFGPLFSSYLSVNESDAKRQAKSAEAIPLSKAGINRKLAQNWDEKT